MSPDRTTVDLAGAIGWDMPRWVGVEASSLQEAGEGL